LHAEFAAAQSSPSRNTTSSTRLSPVSISVLDDFCGALGGEARFAIVWLVVVAVAPGPIPGTPSSDQIVMLVREAESMKSVEVEERLLAGWIVTSPRGGPKKLVMALVPASSCALFQTTNSTP